MTGEGPPSPGTEGSEPAEGRPSVTVLWTRPSLYVSDCLDALRERADVQVWYDTDLALADHALRPGVRRLGEPGVGPVHVPSGTDIVLVGGWRRPRFHRAAWRARRRGAVTILAFDTQPKNEMWWTPKARLLGVALRRVFDGAFVPGDRQRTVATALGFGTRAIQTGLYASREAGSVPRPPGERPPSFLWVGRLVDDKAVDLFLEAYARYRELVEDPWDARIVGDGVLRHLVERSGLEGVEYLGQIPPEEVFRVMAESGCFVSSSRFEPWGMVIAEAASIGLPVICTSAAGASVHLVTDGVSGRVVEPEDPGALAEAMVEVAGADRASWESMGRASEVLSRQFTPRLFADRLLVLAERIREDRR